MATRWRLQRHDALAGAALELAGDAMEAAATKQPVVKSRVDARQPKNTGKAEIIGNPMRLMELAATGVTVFRRCPSSLCTPNNEEPEHVTAQGTAQHERRTQWHENALMAAVQKNGIGSPCVLLN